MSRESENIFSWRSQLSGMEPQERVDFYYEKLREHYQRIVLQAEENRQKARSGDNNDREIQEIFEQWGSEETQGRLNVALERRREKRLNVDRGQEIIDLGLAGLFRIRQVHETQMAGTWFLRWEERQRRLEAAKSVFGRWPSVERTTSNTWVTIHGDPIDWKLEVIQDEVKYWLTAGCGPKAAEIAQKGIDLASKGLVGPKALGELTRLLSVKAVLEYRKAKALRELEPLINSLEDISAVQKQIPNNHRFATINWRVLFAALFYKGNFSLRERLNFVGKAAKNLLELAGRDPKSVLRSFVQIF